MQLLNHTCNRVGRRADDGEIRGAFQLTYPGYRWQAAYLFVALAVDRENCSFKPGFQQVSDYCTAKTALSVRCTDHGD